MPRDEANRTIELGKGLGERFPGWFQKNVGPSRSREEGSYVVCVAPVASTREPCHCPVTAPRCGTGVLLCSKKNCVVILRAHSVIILCFIITVYSVCVCVCAYVACMYSECSVYLCVVCVQCV